MDRNLFLFAFKSVRSEEDLIEFFRLSKESFSDHSKAKYYAEYLQKISADDIKSFCLGNSYSKFTIGKKNGGSRTIHAPDPKLKTIQWYLSQILLRLHNPTDQSHGFEIKKSVLTNSQNHVGKNYVYNIDLKDFFPSFGINYIKKYLRNTPYDFNENLLDLVSNLCTINIENKRSLPQGSPASPVLTNIMCLDLDISLSNLAKKFNCHYTRYADDITFSSNIFIYKNKWFLKELNKAIRKKGLQINPKKTRLQYKTYRQEVTGIIVNEKPNLPKRYIKEVRMYLHYWELYGKKRAESILKKDYMTDKGYIKNYCPPIESVLSGKLAYLKSVTGPDERHQKLLNRLSNLVNDTNKNTLELIQPR